MQNISLITSIEPHYPKQPSVRDPAWGSNMGIELPSPRVRTIGVSPTSSCTKKTFEVRTPSGDTTGTNSTWQNIMRMGGTGYYFVQRRRTRHGIQASPEAHSITGIHTASGLYSAYKVKIQQLLFIQRLLLLLEYDTSRTLHVPAPVILLCGALIGPVLPVTATFAVVDLSWKGTIPKTNTCLLRA
ncbi:hypothetical protein V499_07179 [Pseudogymnoascus sp. VKM F-103]|nr:hypothetical protein V499_07179 [Pseudogymnoascus sp. VKM F-103]